MKYLYIVCALLLLLATLPLPIAYYSILRIIVSTIAILAMASSNKKFIWMICFGVIAFLFNPIIPVYLNNKTMWIIIDILAAIVFLVFLKKNNINKSKIMEEKLLEVVEEKNQVTYHDYGFLSAQHAKSRPDAVVNFLENVYEKFIKEQKLDAQGIKDRIAKLKAEIQLSKTKKNETNAEIVSLQNRKQDKEKQLQELELEKIDIRKGDGETGDTIPFVIAAFITVLLTFYLFIFYSSSAYSAFYGVKEGSLGFINPNVFADAKTSGVIALIILFPVIFLGLGFLIHDSLEKNKKLVSQNKPKQFLTIGILLFVTLIADAFIGYKISQGVHNNEFNSGLSEELWRFELVFKDINFYLVLLLGFVVYIIWGFLLNFVLSHSYLKTESEKTKILVESINLKIEEKRTELGESITTISNLSNLILTLDNEIEGKESDMIGYENGVIPVNIPSLRASVGEFLGGWGAYTNGAFRLTSEELLTQTEIIKHEWLNNKILNIKPEYSNGRV